MALFCQSFKNEITLNSEFKSCEECVDGVGQVSYESRFNVCGDGNVHCTSSNETGVPLKASQLMDKICGVYKSPLIDIDVDVDKESNGYYPGIKKMYSEYVMRDDVRRNNADSYEQHHGCNGSAYCDKFCKK